MMRNYNSKQTATTTVTLVPADIKVKGKVFPYSLLSVGPGADPRVQAVSPQVTWSESRHIPSSSLPLLTVSQPAKKRSQTAKFSTGKVSIIHSARWSSLSVSWIHCQRLDQLATWHVAANRMTTKHYQHSVKAPSAYSHYLLNLPTFWYWLAWAAVMVHLSHT